eukprot:Gb_38437 [translate_table: standard]
MEKSPDVYLGFVRAEQFAREGRIVNTNYFIVAQNKNLEQAKKENTVQFDYHLPKNPCRNEVLAELQMNGVPISIYKP